MRIRKETGPWSWRTFFKVFGLTAAIVAIFVVMDQVVTGQVPSLLWAYLIIYPTLFGSLNANNMRSTQLFINEYRHISDFEEALADKFTREGYGAIRSGGATVFFPTRGLRKFTQRWFGSEEIVVTWGSEIVISGSAQRLSWVEDVLTWNPVFRYATSTN